MGRYSSYWHFKHVTPHINSTHSIDFSLLLCTLDDSCDKPTIVSRASAHSCVSAQEPIYAMQTNGKPPLPGKCQVYVSRIDIHVWQAPLSPNDKHIKYIYTYIHQHHHKIVSDMWNLQ